MDYRHPYPITAKKPIVIALALGSFKIWKKLSRHARNDATPEKEIWI